MSGGGLSDHRNSNLVDQLSSLLEAYKASSSHQCGNSSQPPLEVTQTAANTTPPLETGFSIKKSEPNDIFDKVQLLSLVPRRSKRDAESLITFMSQKPELITFNSTGTLFIDNESIPNSHIHILFPLLFKTGKHDHIPGYCELVDKILELGLRSLIKSKKTETCKIRKPDFEGEGSEGDLGSDWFYLGP